MSPGLSQQFFPSPRRGLVDRPPSVGYDDSDEDEDMAQLEDTYRQSRIQAGPEVEEFGKWLDECGLTNATPTQKRDRVLKLVNRYYDYTHEKAAVLRERRRLEKLARGRRWDPTPSSDDANDVDMDEAEGTDDADVNKWESEAQTWGLLSRLLPLRYPDTSAKPPRPNPASHSRKEYWDDFILTDSVAQERKAVLEWLQTTACAGPDIDDLVHEFQQKADRGDLLAHGWLHTREAIKLHKSVNAISHVLGPSSSGMTDFSYVTQLDPDAMTRQSRKLEAHDEYFERAIWLGCFHLLRRGRSMNEIRDWCVERTEIWRAATISALPLSTQGDEDLPDFDPSSLILWRRMCYALVKSGGTEDWERAVYGILSGDIDSVLAVCKTWDDFIFAHYNALLRTQFDSYLIKQCGPAMASAQFLPSFDAVQYLGDSPNVAKKLIEQIESDGSYFKHANREANTAAKALQGAILANTLESYIYQQGLALSTEANQGGRSYLIPDYGLGSSEGDISKYSKMSDHDGLRVITHVVIMVNALDSLVKHKATDGLLGRHLVGEHAIAAYVSFLRLAQLELLIPLYCAQLSGSRQYETLSLNIIHVRDRDEQLALLNQIRRVGMDIKTFLKQQPQHFLNQLEDSENTCPAKGQFRVLKHGQPQIRDGRGIIPDFMSGDGRIDVVHENLIRSMEWFFAGEGNLLEACEYGIKIYKYLLRHKHLGTAFALWNRVKVDDLIQILANRDGSVEDFVADLLNNEHALVGEVEEDELEDLRAYQIRLGLALKNMWELESFVVASDGIETVGALVQLAQEPETSNPSNRDYFENLGVAIRSAKHRMKPVLDGWLLQTNVEDEEFTQLREAYLPETIIAYVAALQYTGTVLTRDNMLEAMELAATIAEKGSDIAALFVKTGRMKELVEAFASCSKALAIQSADHKKGAHTSTKKMREMGWSRELWMIKPSS